MTAILRHGSGVPLTFRLRGFVAIEASAADAIGQAMASILIGLTAASARAAVRVANVHGGRSPAFKIPSARVRDRSGHPRLHDPRSPLRSPSPQSPAPNVLREMRVSA